MPKAFVLPATEPDDRSFGVLPPEELAGYTVIHIRFPGLVWYNAAIRAETWQQIVVADPGPDDVLIGFSKSGHGALNLALDHPDVFGRIVVFDGPICRPELFPWSTGGFYTQQTWSEDRPLGRLAGLVKLSRHTELILVSGDGFADEMRQMHRAIFDAGGHCRLYDWQLPHRWDSGWIRRSLAASAAEGGGGYN
jgi:pimeloyl-ACP methyl ester carboxylesterase